jgi:hypothetical protein
MAVLPHWQRFHKFNFRAVQEKRERKQTKPAEEETAASTDPQPEPGKSLTQDV